VQARTMRAAGHRTRTAILESARRLFVSRSYEDVSIAEIAAAAEVFPNQITYYFGSKEVLFVEAACRQVLLAGSAVEEASRQGNSRSEYVRAVVDAALCSPGMLTFVDATLLASRNPDVAPLVARTFERLYSVGAKVVEDSLRHHGWHTVASKDNEIRGFWATILGAALERAATGNAFDQRPTEAAIAAILGLQQSDDE
jgi:AcrR family transcriptional regulator